jgi:hypothetical protein
MLELVVVSREKLKYLVNSNEGLERSSKPLTLPAFHLMLCFPAVVSISHWGYAHLFRRHSRTATFISYF